MRKHVGVEALTIFPKNYKKIERDDGQSPWVVVTDKSPHDLVCTLEVQTHPSAGVHPAIILHYYTIFRIVKENFVTKLLGTLLQQHRSAFNGVGGQKKLSDAS